jgi:hypothetical protein
MSSSYPLTLKPKENFTFPMDQSHGCAVVAACQPGSIESY